MARPPLPPPPLLDPAWYPDPTGRYEARYWDGRRWTSHISHYGATGADPLLRARFDHWWLRALGRVVLWVAFAGVVWWAFNEYWPSNERDLVADEQVATSGVLALADLPTGWIPAPEPLISPLTLTPDEESGELDVEACAAFADVVDNSLDEPTRRQSFESSTGMTAIAHSTTVGADSGFARSFLTTGREAETGACLTALLEAVGARAGSRLTVTSSMAMTDPAFGDEAMWWRMSAEPTVAGPGQFFDLVAVRVDRVLTEYVFVGEGDYVAVDIQRDVIQLQTGRVRALLDALDADDDCSDDDPDCETDPSEADPTPDAEDPAADPATEAEPADG